MPVQINEVIISAVVDNTPAGSTTQPDSSTGGDTIKQVEIAENVLEILKEKQER